MLNRNHPQGETHLRSSLNSWHSDFSGAADDAEGIEHPDDDADDHHDVEYLLNLPVHRDVVVDQPEQYADDDESDDERD